SLPSPFAFDPPYRPYPHGYSWHYSERLEVEGENGVINPHVIANTYQFCDHAQENRILYGELAALLDCMKRRANQRKVEDPEEQEKLFWRTLDDGTRMELPEIDVTKYEYQFPAEKHFPVLLLSYVRPKHARILYACMGGPQITIRQSKLYSFETRAIAPVNLFARYLLSTALMTD
ncbi:hypothetical protein BO70DRAFT_419984, partial [Aspergillus heteromorphus CBS 117.55]